MASLPAKHMATEPVPMSLYQSLYGKVTPGAKRSSCFIVCIHSKAATHSSLSRWDTHFPSAVFSCNVAPKFQAILENCQPPF